MKQRLVIVTSSDQRVAEEPKAVLLAYCYSTLSMRKSAIALMPDINMQYLQAILGIMTYSCQSGRHDCVRQADAMSRTVSLPHLGQS